MSAVAHVSTPTRWRPSPVIGGSIALHAIAGIAVIAASEILLWWALAAVAANHAVLTVLGLWPRSTLLGPNFIRLPDAAAARGEIALTFDDGPDPEVTPKVLDLLDAAGARATFFCIAERAAQHPEVCREIARRGHMVENHSRGHHPTFPMLGLGGIRREVTAAQRTLGEISGRAPRFFRPPAGLRNPLLDPVLHNLGLKLVSWTRRGFDTRHADVALVSERLLRGLAAGDILLLHDGHSARTRDGAAVVLEVLPRVLQAARSRGLRPVTLAQAIDP
ncbi:MAG TPA: polysaccharide deacetylase family protein [Usitatibacter sp.]|nr:polysaccharide deacetylase family protein [Usitatibacter sp.]